MSDSFPAHGGGVLAGPAVDPVLLARVRDALAALEADSPEEGRSTAAAATALFRVTREALAALDEARTGRGPAAAARAHAHRTLVHRILEAASRRPVRVALHASPFAREWTELLLDAVLLSDHTVASLFFSRARALGDRTLFLLPRNDPRGRISWREAEERIVQTGRALLATRAAAPAGPAGGARPGPVAILGENSVELALLDLACLVTGTVNVPVPANSPAARIGYILEHAGASRLFLGGDESAQLAHSALARAGIGPSLHWLDPAREAEGPVRSFAEFLETGRAVPVERVREVAGSVRAGDLATVMYTSGTTGVPKGVPFTQGNLVTKRFARAAAWPDLGGGDVFLCYLPLYHTFGRWLEMLGCVFWGSVYAFVEDASLEPLLYSFQRVRPTTFISVPKKWIQIAETVGPVAETEASAQDDERLAAALVEATGGRLRRGLSAAGYLPPSVFHRFHAAGIELHSGFGMTEATGGITMTPPGEYRDDSIGVALPGIELEIAHDGELLIRGPYVTSPAEGDSPREDGWFATGDIVRRDPHGHLRIVDRKKEIFKNVQGETISPRRIESLFADFESVHRVLVVGDRRNYCTALIVPSEELRDEYGGGNGPTLESHALREIFAPVVATVNRFLATYERILDFAILARDLDPERELTAKGTPRRKVVAERRREIIDSLYSRDEETLRVGDLECRVPHWFLRQTGIPSREISAEDDGLVMAGRKLGVRKMPDGGVIVGDLEYDPGGEELLLGQIFGRAELWLGNEAVRTFTGPGIENWWRRGRRFRVRTRVRRRPIGVGVVDGALPPVPAQGLDIPLLHATARQLSHPDPSRRREAVELLGRELPDLTPEMETLAREILLSTLEDSPIRPRALRALVPCLSPADLDELLTSRLRDASFLTAEEARVAGLAPLRGDQLERLVSRARAWGREERSVPPGSPLDRLLGYLVRQAVEHPASHRRVRSLLASLEAEVPGDGERERIEEHLEALVTGFRRRLPPAEPAGGIRWEEVVEFRGEIDDDHRSRILAALSSTKLLPEAIVLLGPDPSREPRPLSARSIRVTFLGEGTGRAVYLLEWAAEALAADSPRFECIVKANRGVDWGEIRDEIRLLLRARTGATRRPVVKTQGGSYEEHGLWTEEFVPGRTLDALVEELSREEADGARGRLPDVWPFLVSSCTALIVDFWKRTGRRVTLARPTPAKVVLPAHDWQVGGRLVSIADRVACKRLSTVLESIQRGIVRPLRERFLAALPGSNWPLLFSAALEVLGEDDGLTQLEEEAAHLDPDGELAPALRRFVSGVRRHGFLPIRIRVAARRYRRWVHLNPDATLEAQAATLDQIEDAYGLGELDRARPGSRLQLFRHTVFRGTDPDLAKGLEKILTRDPGVAPSLAELHREVARLRERHSPSDRDEFFLARMLYPHVDPGSRAVLVREEDAAGGFDTGVEVEHRDRSGSAYRIRRPANPHEIAALTRVFQRAGFRRVPVGDDDLLVVTEERGRVIGGVISRRMSETYVRLEWLVVSRRRTGQGIGSTLVTEFLQRLQAQGIRVVSTGFFRPAFWVKLGFGFDPRYAGLVRFLQPESEEESAETGEGRSVPGDPAGPGKGGLSRGDPAGPGKGGSRRNPADILGWTRRAGDDSPRFRE